MSAKVFRSNVDLSGKIKWLYVKPSVINIGAP